ncbi:hypothetical protein NSK_005988 [Nannochloropsis salina CCMP1776]|uniref:Uncharacterized protein n=1 Tax=Nannochloropsis salina CCMP1776 TaxID=1027361 RepID=A0A4D9CTN9_9STRA|nr:hypothetical protein NSK_005988 [Nannochloropsis salina CCMP1776]|eukprot:TFJ82562.1 hypothetical protein NSK_005988 [Nannochloropsis salina CCMP1776]
MDQQAMREARLRALGQPNGDCRDTEEKSAEVGQASLSGSMASPREREEEGWMVVDTPDCPATASPAAATATASPDSDSGSLLSQPLSAHDMDALRGLLWPADVTEDDVSRWHTQGFSFTPSSPPSPAPPLPSLP